MKIILNPNISKLKGKLGDLVIKQLYGKTYICRKPRARNKNSYSGAELAMQKRFKLNCKLSKCINQIDEYKQFWHKAAIGKMSNFNAILKANYPHVKPDSIDIGICLTPDSIKMDFSEYGFCFDNNTISLELKNDTIGVVKDYNVDNLVMFAGVIFLSNPIGYENEEFKFIYVKSDTEMVVEGEQTMLYIKLDGAQMQTIERYNDCFLHFGFISKDKEGNVINEISTFTEDLNADT